MQILHLTDTHLGMRRFVRGAPPGWSRADDHLAAMRTALQPALHEQVDLVVHTGDLFDRSRPPRRSIAQAADLLCEVARRVPVVLLAGNHDRRGLRPHLPLLTPGLHVVDQAERLVVAGVALAVVPYLSDAAGWAAAARRAVGPGVDLLLCHQAFDGCQVPGFTFRAGRQRDTIGAAHLPAGVRHVACGHIHPRQVLQVGHACVVMPGSTERTSFSERTQPKGAAVWRFDASVTADFVDLPTRPMVLVQQPGDLAAVKPGSLVRTTDAQLEPLVLARGGWLCGRPADAAAPAPRRPRPQLPLFATGGG